ncbi:MAG: hypothetical protein KJ630_18385 [Proteobacteria bacterium]|nr:hypothetical protein [Pseudomonadota bacterium]
MFKFIFHNWLFLRFCISILTISVVVLPLAPVACAAAKPPAVSDTLTKEEKGKPAQLNDHKKVAATNPQDDTASGENEGIKGGEKLTPEHKNSTIAKNSDKLTNKNPPEETEEGMPTLTKVGIGIGAAAVVGGVLLLAGGGVDGGKSGPRYPTAAELVGPWSAQAKNDEYHLTYFGVYNLYAIGFHTYDIYGSGGDHKQGTGTWSIGEKTNTLTLNNDSGSTYVGDFQNENFTTISMNHTVLKWELVLTKQ